ncbi:hypothetical protein [Geminocystis sp. NIES-3709]|uniref:terminase small subunit-like protein n=1 Tax=Geminocystis sp. NIES-3709 TaxID=1617448 RepID=UPI0005FC3D8D|nr:hypothetical protein [Geminocystis sp. NIES-3709]BAQ65553.1 hypothetical protein GM3709_2318 [Geminocystis sp. NIES-3709]
MDKTTKGTKYNEQIITDFLELISDGQTLDYSCDKVNISVQTIRNWLKKYPDFAERYEKAKQYFKDNCPEKIRVSAKDRIKELITHGHRIKRSNLTIHSLPVYKNGQIVGYKEKWREEHLEETNMGTPQWAIDRVLPPPPKDLESAIKLIEAYGLKPVVANTELFREWLVAQTTSQNSQTGSARGLTESEANEIRARILGVSEDATDTPTVSTEMGKG